MSFFMAFHHSETFDKTLVFAVYDYDRFSSSDQQSKTLCLFVCETIFSLSLSLNCLLLFGLENLWPLALDENKYVVRANSFSKVALAT